MRRSRVESRGLRAPRSLGASRLATFLVLLTLLAAVASFRGANAQTGGVFDLRWNKIASGGVNTSSGGTFSLAGTIGQPDAGASTSAGGIFELTGGFWTGVSLTQLADAPAPPAAPAVLSLRGFQQNPTVASRLQVEFSLASAAPARLELIDVSGRRVNAYAVGLLGPGRHTLDLGAGVSVLPGLYWIRLAQGGIEQVRKAVVMK